MPHDLQLWCEDCQAGYEGDCVRHGPFTRVRDTEVDTRARRSIPTILQLRDQQDFTGVYARQNLSKRLQFGPLQAIKVLDGTDKAKEAALQIKEKGGLVVWVSEESGQKFLLDTRQEERTNWMCFVRAAQHKAQQNIVAFQYRGQIFFVTIKEIQADCELRVWYSKDYAERMGTGLLSEERISWQFRTRERFHCAGCSLVFSSSSSLANHCCTGNGGVGSGKQAQRTPAELASALTTTIEVSATLVVTAPSTSRAGVSVTAVTGSLAGISRGIRQGRGLSIRGSAIFSAFPTKGRIKGRSRELRATQQQVTLEPPSGPPEGVSKVELPEQFPAAESERLSVPSEYTKQLKRKYAFVEEIKSESVKSGVRVEAVPVSTTSAERAFARGRSSKGGTPKRLKSTHIDVKCEVLGVSAEESHESGSATVEEESITDILKRTAESSVELTEQETDIASGICAQVLQSVHSLSSSEDSGKLILQESVSGIPERVESFHKIVPSEEVALESVVVEGAGVVEAREDIGIVLHGEQVLATSELCEELTVEAFGEDSSLFESEGGSIAAGESEITLEGQDTQTCTVCGEVGVHACPIRIFSCPDCNKSFSSRFKLSRHQLIHGGERQYSCNICDRSFHRKDHLKNHLQIHEPTKQFKCERLNCGKEYNSYMSYRKHCAFHSAEEGDLQCKFCYKMFDNKNDLVYHLKVHVGTRSVKNPSEKKFQCDQCERRFFTRKDVKRHLVVHTGTRDFCCSLCPQKFGRKDHLVRHIKKSHGVTDMSRLETLADPLAVPGTSGLQAPTAAPLSPGLSSISTSSGDTTGLSYLLPSSPTSHSSLPSTSPVNLPSYQEVGATSFGGFIGEPDPGDLRILVPEPIKEEPDLTASMMGLGPDLSNILGLYLPSNEGINMASLMETTPGHVITTQPSPLHLATASGLQPPPPAYSSPHFQSLSSLDPSSYSSPGHASPRPLEPHEVMSATAISCAATTAPTSTTTTTTTAASTSSQSLPGFDQAFP